MKQLKMLMLFITLTIFIQCCKGDKQKAEIGEYQAIPFDSSCIYLKNIDFYLSSISNNPRKWMSGNDSCVLEIIDTLTCKYIQTNQKSYIIALDSISKHSDGYISEFLAYMYTDIFTKNTNNFINYMTSSPHYQTNISIDLLAGGIVAKLNTDISGELTEDKIDTFLKKYILRNEKEFYNFLKQRILYFKSN